ncbi:MAG: DUF1853 family protein [Lentimonas sp.]
MDLARYLCSSLKQAPLLMGEIGAFSPFDRELLGTLPSEIELNFQQKLGHLYENALECLLQESPDLEIVASHLQVMDREKRTLGELDFLLTSPSEAQAIHLELAVKFYLAVQVDGSWQFPGPDPRDNWQNKLDRMRNHQLALSQHPAAQKLLLERFNLSKVVARQLVYGCLFYPVSVTARPMPEAANPDCRIGRWLYLSEGDLFFADKTVLRLIPKPLWPAEMSAELVKGLPLISVDELRTMAAERCTLFCFEDQMEPIFLVPDDWLEGSGS